MRRQLSLNEEDDFCDILSKEKARVYPYMNMILHISSVAQSCPTLCDPMDCSMPGFPVYYQLPELAQTHVHWVGDAIQPSHPLSSPSPPALHLFQHQGLFKWVSSLYQVAKVLEFQLQHRSFQWYPVGICKPDALWLPRGVRCGGKWEGVSRMRGHMYTYGWLGLMYGRDEPIL